MAQCKEDLEYMSRKLHEEYSKWDFTINFSKTQYMALGTGTDELQSENNEKINKCAEYKYLGSILTNDGKDTKNIRNRIV